ncbi:undecaprenyl/decaprenyl-phosphate alpha-N-acetylglucosaminyl 1-phosphate transferase [Candidatus Poribacteria bacterium]|nr:undecaprenyl/decaprenyl-phosphate alpha-N-acetylglucosaminyl 1-phosphate transferase [Candidatus Poribacteria bacterium]
MPAFLALALLAFLQALAAGVLLTPLARRLGPRLGMVDTPNLDRKIHSHPIPRSGGLAIFAVFWGSLALDVLLAGWLVPGLEWIPEPIRVLAGNIRLKGGQLGAIAAGAAVIFVLGAADDARGLPARLRLGVQILAVVPLIAGGVVIKVFLPGQVGWLLTALWVVLLTNSFNFLDNMNGLTSGISIIVAGVMALLSALSGEYYMLLVFALLAGAATGFWFFNFPKATIFLGDSGSTHLGFLFGALTAVSTYYEQGVPTRLPILMPVIVLGVPLFDTLSVLWIRWRSGKPLMVGDTNHFSHRLVALGMTRTEAVLFIYLVTMCVGLAAVALRPLDWRYGLVQTAVIALVFVLMYLMERVSKRPAPDSREVSPK